MNDELLKFAACHAMSDEQLERMAGALERRSIREGEKLFEEGDDSDVIYFVHQGAVSIRMRRNGREEVLASLGPGSVLGEMGAVLEQPRSAEAVADEDSQVSILTARQLTAWIDSGESVAVRLLNNFLRIMASRIRKVNAKLVELAGSEQVQPKMRDELTQFRQKLFSTWSF